MINKVKRKFVLGAVVLSAAMALAACDLSGANTNNPNPSSSSDNPISFTSSAIDSNGNSSILSSDSSIPVYLTGITAVSNKESYEIGDQLDLTVTATYSNGDVVTIESYETEGFNNRKAGEQEVTVTYGGKSTTVTVTVTARVVSITVTNNQDSYEVGDPLDLTVTAIYSDDTTTEVTEYDVTGYDSQTPGTQSVVISYEGQAETVEIIVNVPVVTSITVVDNKASTGYEVGDELDLTVTADYSNHVSYEIEDYEVAGYDSYDFGTQTISVKYEEKTASIDVLVNEPDNLFPNENLNAFLEQEHILSTIPTPVGYKTWSESVETYQDGSKYFSATTDNKVLDGRTTMVESYSALLKEEGWDISSSSGTYFASKDNADAKIEFTVEDDQFALSIYAYEKYPTRKTTGKAIVSSNSLRNGNTLVFGNVEYGVVATGLENGAFEVKGCQYVNGNMSTVAKNALRLQLGKISNGRWTLSDYQGRKLGQKEVGELAWDEGNTEWIISISSTSTLIVNYGTSTGYLCYDQNNSTITTFSPSARQSKKVLQFFSIDIVDVVYPNAISVSGNAEVALGKKTKLNVTFDPITTTEKAITWSSSDESILKVNNNGIVTGEGLGTATITATVFNKDVPVTATFEISVVEKLLDAWTILFYICGADLESGYYAFATSDINEMLSVSGQPEDVNIVIQTGGARSWHMSGISSNKIGRYHIENKQLKQDASLPNASMGAQSTLESFVNWGLEEYPAEKTGLVLWNHGGAFEGCCYDENYYDDSLEAQEIKGAMDNVFAEQNLTEKLEFIGYDCCLMQLQDLAEFNSPYFNYMVGSEETESGYGWDYDNWFDDLFAGAETEDILAEICDTFLAENGWNSDQTLAVLDLNKMDNYFNKFETMSAAIKDKVNSNKSTFKNVINSCKKYEDFYRFGLFDGKDFLNKLASNNTFSSFATQINDAKTALSEMIIHNAKGSGAGNSNGLAFFAPLGSYGTAASYPSNQTHFNNWKALF